MDLRFAALSANRRSHIRNLEFPGPVCSRHPSLLPELTHRQDVPGKTNRRMPRAAGLLWSWIGQPCQKSEVENTLAVRAFHLTIILNSEVEGLRFRTKQVGQAFQLAEVSLSS